MHSPGSERSWSSGSKAASFDSRSMNFVAKPNIRNVAARAQFSLGMSTQLLKKSFLVDIAIRLFIYAMLTG
jgi:hypothetical protein